MKIKTSELTGAALDWAVAKCEDLHTGIDGFWSTAVLEWEENPYKYSTNWLTAGPIVQRERIGLMPSGTAYYQRDGGTYYSYGPTPLIAVMRCYVASKLGDEVEVPDQLTS